MMYFVFEYSRIKESEELKHTSEHMSRAVARIWLLGGQNGSLGGGQVLKLFKF